MKGVHTFLMFNDQAEEAVRYYASVLPRTRIVDIILSAGEEGPEGVQGIAPGKVHVAVFEIAGHEFYACDGGPDFAFSMGTSLWLDCESQKEIDAVSDALIEGGGQQLDCGWVEDRCGVFWQIVPAKMRDWMLSDDRASALRMHRALMTMKRIDMAALEKAVAGEEADAGR
jgi:predicted 3-demethylubiquinone-9 3-methyltransferase (glyoxalase superfamily)